MRADTERKQDYICRFEYLGKRCVLPNSDFQNSDLCRWHKACNSEIEKIGILKDVLNNQKKYFDMLRRPTDIKIDEGAKIFEKEAKELRLTNHELFKKKCKEDRSFYKFAKLIGD